MTDFCKNCNHILDMTKTLPTNVNREHTEALENEGRELLNTATPEALSDTDNDQEPKYNTKSNSKSKSKSKSVESYENKTDNIDQESDLDTDTDNKEDELHPEIDEESEEFYETILMAIENNQPLSNEQLAKIDIGDMIKTHYYRNLKTKSEIKKKILGLIDDMGNSDENTAFYLCCTNCGYSRALDSGFHILSKNPDGVAASHDYSDESKIRNVVHYGIHPRTREFICPNTGCDSLKPGNPTEAVFLRDESNRDSYRMIYICTTCLTIKRL